MKTKGVTGVRSAEANQGTFESFPFFIKVKIKLHPVAPVGIQSCIGFISSCSHYSGGYRSGYHRPGYIFRTEAVTVDIGDPRKYRTVMFCPAAANGHRRY